MVSFRRRSRQVSAVVLALAEQPATWRYGYELWQRLDLTSGSLYPALMRLADRGLLETTWESEVPAGRRPRHRQRVQTSRLHVRGAVIAVVRNPIPIVDLPLELVPWLDVARIVIPRGQGAGTARKYARERGTEPRGRLDEVWGTGAFPTGDE